MKSVCVCVCRREEELNHYVLPDCKSRGEIEADRVEGSGPHVYDPTIYKGMIPLWLGSGISSETDVKFLVVLPANG